MEHRYIKKHHIADRYLLRTLSAEDLINFEEHILECRECVDRLRMVERFRAGLRTVAAEDEARTGTALHPRFLVARARLSPVNQWAWLAGITLLIILSAVLLVRELTSAHRELAQAQQALSEWQRRDQERRQRERNMMQEAQARELQLSAERDRLSAQLEVERRDRRRLAAEVNQATAPQTAVPVFALSVARNGDSGRSQPANDIILSTSSHKLIVLLLELGPEPDLQFYRATVSTFDGRRLWSEDNLKPSSQHLLALSFKSDLFKPNDYLLTLEGLTPQGEYAPVTQYTYRVRTR